MPDACHAGPESGNELCKLGHRGVLCALCSDSFTPWARGCVACDDDSGNLLVVFAVIIIFIFLVGIFVMPVTASTSSISICFKILISFLQTLGILQGYAANWSSALTTLLSWVDATNLDSSMFSPGCSEQQSSFYSIYVGVNLLPLAVIGKV